jgi:hypothetical protein
MRPSHRLYVVIALSIVAADCRSAAPPVAPVLFSPGEDELLDLSRPPTAAPAAPQPSAPVAAVVPPSAPTAPGPFPPGSPIAANSIEGVLSANAGPPFPYSTALAEDPVSARGHLMGSEYGDAYGVAGLGMLDNAAGDPNGFGAASGDGSALHGYGLADVGSMGHGYGTADGVGAGGGAVGRAAPDLRGSAAPELRLGEATTYGGLSKEVIRRVVAQNRGRVRHCYETALLSDPAAAGRVTVKFVIAPEGRVSYEGVFGEGP